MSKYVKGVYTSSGEQVLSHIEIEPSLAMQSFTYERIFDAITANVGRLAAVAEVKPIEDSAADTFREWTGPGFRLAYYADSPAANALWHIETEGIPMSNGTATADSFLMSVLYEPQLLYERTAANGNESGYRGGLIEAGVIYDPGRSLVDGTRFERLSSAVRRATDTL